jgi:hypothetical protein
MLNRRVVCIAFVVALVGSLPSPLAAAEKKRTNVIKIVEATYGGNCPGVEKGNVTPFVAAGCVDDDLCNYRVYYKQLGGDPAPGCDKDFKVTYTCGRSTRRNTCDVAAEAGKGGEDGYPNQFCLLHCLSASQLGGPAAGDNEVTTQAISPRPRASPIGKPVYRYRVERLPDGRVQVSGPFYGPWP